MKPALFTAPGQAKLISAVLPLTLLGAGAHHALGAAVATLLILFALPLLAGLATIAWVSRGDSSDLVRVMALRAACAVAVFAPLFALPGALLGWAGFSTLMAGAAVAHARALTA